MRNLRKITLSELPEGELRVLGRTNGSLDPLTLFFNASGIEMNVKGSELWVDLHVNCGLFEPWLDIVINGERTQRIMLTPESRRVCIYRNLSPETVRNVKVLRDTQPMPDDPYNLLEITGMEFSLDTVFEKLTLPSMRIEFLGDSLTTGEGLCGSTIDDDWGPQCMDSIPNYTFMTAADLDAEYRVFSFSGWGVCVSWRNDPYETIPRHYEKFCDMLAPEYAKYGVMENWDFTSWQPDVIVVNLGTNDQGAFETPAHENPLTHVVTKMHMLPDGRRDPVDLLVFENAVYDFLLVLRNRNPEAYILWAMGMLGDSLLPEIRNAVRRFKEVTGDSRVDVIPLPDTKPGEFGARSHAGKIAHRHAADTLVKRIREIRANPFEL